MRRVARLYLDAFSGLSAPTWVLSAVMLINRSGAMVLPFMSIYLTEHLGFSKEESGFVLMAYGVGAISGTTLGGFLTDRVGHFKVQAGSLILTGVYFLFLPQLSSFWAMVIGVYFLSTIADTVRPANGASIGHYAKKENVTKAFSLNRMAINLGYSIGPAIGGVLAGVSFKYLFYADGLTCIAAGVVFAIFFSRYHKENKPEKHTRKEGDSSGSPWMDKAFIGFCLSNTLYAIVFFQILSSLPLYYREVYELSKSQIGGMLALNGLIIFGLEMVIVHVWGEKYKLRQFLVWGALLVAVSFAMLNFYHGFWWLVVAMIVLSFSEIFAMPFAISFISQRAPDHSKGKYMGLFSASYALAHIVAPQGLVLAEKTSFSVLWWVCGLLGLAATVGFYFSATGMTRVAKTTSSQEGT